MTRRFALSCVARLMESLLPRDVGEVVVGDLCEEYALRIQSAKRTRATRWLVLQAAASVPRLLFSSFLRWSWLKSLGVAAAAFVVLGQIEPLVHVWLSQNFDPSVGQQMIISLLVGFAACACGGFLSTWAYRGSALFYSMIGTGFMVSAIASVDLNEPLWFLGGFVVIAMAAPIIGGAGFVAIADRVQTPTPNTGV